MSPISLLVIDWVLTAQLGVACGVGVAAEVVGGLAVGKGLAFSILSCSNLRVLLLGFF